MGSSPDPGHGRLLSMAIHGIPERPRATPPESGETAAVRSGPPRSADLLLSGAAIVYRLYDVGYEIHLDRALDRLASSAPERVRPVRGEAQAIQIKNPPITVILGNERVQVGGAWIDGEVSARIFDFGVLSLRIRLPAPAGC